MLTLFEKLQILTIHEIKGTFIRLPAEKVKFGLVGAVLADLALLDFIRSSENHRLHLQNSAQTGSAQTGSAQTGSALLDDAVGFLREAEKERKFTYWVNLLGQKMEKISRRVNDSLVQKGVVAHEDDRLSWVIPSPLQPELKGSSKFTLIRKLRGIVLAQDEAELSDLILLSLLRAAGLLELVFLRDERKYAAQLIYEMGISQSVQNPVLTTIQEIESAIAETVEED